MKKLFISQPMRGLTDEEILKVREEIRIRAEYVIGEPVELIDSFIKDYPGEINKSIPVWYLGKSIEFLSQADIAYFGGDWRNARGCTIEYDVANAYGIKVIKEYFTDDKFTLTKDSNNDKLSISLTGKDGVTLVLKLYEEIKNNDKILGLFTDDDTSLDEVKAGLKEDIDNLKEEMDSYSDEVVISYDIYLNKNTLVKQELTIEDMVLTITGEDSGDISLISGSTTIVSGTYSKDNLNLKISTDMVNAEFSINRQNITEDKISGDYKTTIKLTSGGSTIDVTINTNVKYDKSASIPNIDLSTAKSFDEITDNELEEIYSKLYPILEPIMGNIDNEEIETTY